MQHCVHTASFINKMNSKNITLCRLCATKDNFCKDLLDEKNKVLLKSIQDFLNIHVSKSDVLPTKICLNCEETMVTFHLYVLECHKVQTSLKKMFLETQVDIPIKTEIDENGSNCEPHVKIEVESIAEDIVRALGQDENSHADFACSFDESANFQNDDESYDEQDDVSIATLKKTKTQLPDTPNSIFRTADDQTNNGEVNRLKCTICDKIAKNWACLERHFRTKHKESKPKVGCHCGATIKTKSVFLKHKRRKLCNKKSDDLLAEDQILKGKFTSYVKFNCPQCDKLFTSWYSLHAHCSEIHSIRTVVQCKCGISIKSKSALYKHIQDHKEANGFCCDKCPRVVKTLEALEKHKMRHIPKSERRFYCRSCEKVFNSRDKLKSHEKSHVPIKERKIHQCDRCDLKFTTPSAVVSHARIVHDRIKSYVCDLCGYACGTSGELKQHRAIHSDDKPHVCSKCDKRFKTYANLKTHMDTHEDTSYSCYVCSRVLNSRRTLRKHLLVHDDECRHVCSYCNKAFKRRQTLKKTIYKSVKVESIIHYPCRNGEEDCLFYKVHMATHTGDKPLTCKWCSEKFTYASTLRSHRLRCHPDKMAPAAPNKLLMLQHGNIVMAEPNQPYTYNQQANHQQINYIKADTVQEEKNEVEAML